MVCSVCWLSAARECGSTSSEVSWLERVSRPRRAPTRRVECGSAFSTQDRALENGFRIGGSHYVDPSLNTITGPDGPTRLEPKVMQVLVCLTAHAGEVVTKDRLMRTVWPDTFVGDDVLTRAISELRRVFGDDARNRASSRRSPKVAIG